MTNKITIGVVALARPTFDVPYAEQVATTAWETLQGLDGNIAGSKDLLFDASAVESAISSLRKQLQGQVHSLSPRPAVPR